MFVQLKRSDYMSRNEFICDCNVIHDEVVENTIKEMPKEDRQQAVY